MVYSIYMLREQLSCAKYQLFSFFSLHNEGRDTNRYLINVFTKYRHFHEQYQKFKSLVIICEVYHFIKIPRVVVV